MVPKKQKKILITGANFRNLGACSMLFTLVDQINIKYPDYEIVLIDLFPSITEARKKDYTFNICNFHIRSLIRIIFPFSKIFIKPHKIWNNEKSVVKNFKEAQYLFDLSGYGFSSHNQKLIWSVAYLFPIKFAKKNNVEVFLLPQSLGPFKFKGLKKLLLLPYAKKILQYPKIVFARETKSMEYIQEIRCGKNIQSFDIVLQCPSYSPQNIYQNLIPSRQIECNKGVLIIPNKQLLNFINTKSLVDLYQNIIEHINNKGIFVTLLKHSVDDEELTNMIFNSILEKDKLELLKDDYSPSEMEFLINGNQFVITGRYHGLIHSLKNLVPCIVFGWANKYIDLMKTYNLEKYMVDFSTDISENNILTSIDQLIDERDSLSNQIKLKNQEIQQNNIFDKYLSHL